MSDVGNYLDSIGARRDDRGRPLSDLERVRETVEKVVQGHVIVGHSLRVWRDALGKDLKALIGELEAGEQSGMLRPEDPIIPPKVSQILSSLDYLIQMDYGHGDPEDAPDLAKALTVLSVEAAPVEMGISEAIPGALASWLVNQGIVPQ